MRGQKGGVQGSSSVFIEQRREGKRRPAARATNGHGHYRN
jgi:hypothetical protein